MAALNRRLTLEAPQRVADGAGGFVETWDTLGTLWAEVRALRGREGLTGAATVSGVPCRITVRGAAPGAASRPAPHQRFRDGSRVWNILAVSEAPGPGTYLICDAVEEVSA